MDNNSQFNPAAGSFAPTAVTAAAALPTQQQITNLGSAILEVVPKSWTQSQTVLSGLLALLSGGFGAWTSYKTGDMTAFGASLTAAMAGVGAIAGRIKAVQPIK